MISRLTSRLELTNRKIAVIGDLSQLGFVEGAGFFFTVAGNEGDGGATG
jgi:hypothetical protein